MGPTRTVSALAASLAYLAGLVALAGMVCQAGLGPPWLDRLDCAWLMPDDALAERGYERLLAGGTGDALALFDIALRRDPASPYRWCDLGEAWLAAGNLETGRRCILRGAELGRYSAPIQVRALHAAWRTGDRAWALTAGRAVLGLTRAYDHAVSRVWSHMGLDTREIPGP